MTIYHPSTNTSNDDDQVIVSVITSNGYMMIMNVQAICNGFELSDAIITSHQIPAEPRLVAIALCPVYYLNTVINGLYLFNSMCACDIL
jgi:hypothetical protein